MAAVALPRTPAADEGGEAAKDRIAQRLRRRRREAPSEAPTLAPSPPPTPKHLASTPIPTGAPYQERRLTPAVVPLADDRREPTLPEVMATSELVRATLGVLGERGAATGIATLSERVSERVRQPAVGLRAALLAENSRCRTAGLRPPFVVQYSGDVGLTAWGLSERHRELEEVIARARAELRELVQRELLGRVGKLSDTGFEQVVVMLLEQMGHAPVKVVHRKEGGSIALTVRDRGDDVVAVVARRAWSPIGSETVCSLGESLAHFDAVGGMILTLGGFTDAARAAAASADHVPVRLVDGGGLAGLLYEHGVGAATYAPRLRYIDADFFDSLG